MRTPLKRKMSGTTSTELPHDEFFNKLIAEEYARVAEKGHTYLDFTGGNLYAKSQLAKHYKLLNKNVFGNPHSTNPTSQLSAKLVEDSRKKVLNFFNADDYFCVFTQNASGALKIIGECYPFNKKGAMLLLADNHNSVNGIREYCANKSGCFEYCPIQYEDLRIDIDKLDSLLEKRSEYINKLFAFPAQSNVSGVKHDLNWIQKAQKLGWDVLLDAAAFVPTSKLNLSIVKPDFVSISFYKIFGYPTGVGCLLIKKSKFNKLVKPWFAGGTVTLASVQTRHHYLANNHERFEDGTINYLDIPAIRIGLDYIESIGIRRINERITGLINYLISGIKEIKHNSKVNVVKIFGPEDRKNTGGTVIMNFFDKNGRLYPFEQIEQKANAELISIRSGCFCNPGIDEINNCLTTEELSNYFTSRDNGNYDDMINFLNKMRGATRISVGIATGRKDIETFISFVGNLKDKSIEHL
ncbi:MAG: aminotransferase class V-fold PLP-dependent enzyme [Epsilonproteobacteria bacterium]|nr:aminotransferase class V-fold PLP-dependent enzyme [Campylobacterota bacterium]